jgi:hypothetical protein
MCFRIGGGPGEQDRHRRTQARRHAPAFFSDPAMNKSDGTPVSEELCAWFTALAQAQGWTCAVCGHAIRVDSRFTYFSTGRCVRCEEMADELQG